MSGLAEQEVQRSAASRWLRIGGGAALLVLALAGAVHLAQQLAEKPTPGKKVVTKITVLPETAPPPPPPPPPPREQPKESREIKQDQPKPMEMPRDIQQLKMEGPAGEGASPFAAGAVTQDYRGGEVGNVGGGGVDRMQFAFFTSALQRHIQDELARNRRVQRIDYRVKVNVWIGSDGAIRRAELAESTGSADDDEALRAALAGIAPLRGAVPGNLPQPVKLRITNRMTG